MATKQKTWHEIVGKFAYMVALFVAFVPSIIFFFLVSHHEKRITKAEAVFVAETINHIIKKEPQFWQFQQYQLDSLASRRRVNYQEEHVVIRSKKRGIISESKNALTSPTITQSAPLLDSGRHVGTVDVTRSVRPMVVMLAFVAFFSFLFGIVVYFLVLTFPQRSLQNAFASLEDEKELAQVTLNAIGDAVIRVDRESKVEFMNPAAENLLGWVQEEVVGLPVERILNLVDDRSFQAIDNQIDRCFAENSKVMIAENVLLIRGDGKQFHIESSVAPFFAQHGGSEKAVVVLRDISERLEAREQLEHMSQYDALTGLPNRSLHQRRLSQAIARSRRSNQMVGLLFIDLDRFKTVNDSMGHNVGDQLLNTVSQRLIHCVRAEDTLSRMGGDEFAVILEGISSSEGAAVVAKNILEQLSQPFYLEGKTLFISGSIGVVIHEYGDTPELMLQNAEIAMYRAKENGRNNYQFFESDMNSAIAERMELETALRQALQKQEFVLHYQPKLDLADGKITSVEALLRWQRPEVGIIPPYKFIPVLEETNMIIEVGEWVIGEACRQAKEWQEMEIPIKIAVNLSAKQLEHPHLESRVREILMQHNLPGRLLEFEITESIFLSQLEQTEFTLNSIKALGICFSIDDFGTGYSSLGYLKRFPIDSLKIDKSFIDNLVTAEGSRTLAKAIIALAHSLSMRVIAEGVETEDQREILRQMDCDEIQGHLVSQAVDASTFANFYKSTLGAQDAVTPA